MAVWVQSPAWCGGLKDPALPQLGHSLHLWLGFDPWPQKLPYAMGEAKKKKKKSGILMSKRETFMIAKYVTQDLIIKIVSITNSLHIIF